LFLVLALLSCGAPPPPSKDSAPQEQIQWEPIASWSGRGGQQLDSFQSDSGALRIEWEAKRTAGATGAGSLKLIVHSAISGRPLAAAVLDHQGEGKGTAYFSEEPRVFFLDVTSTDVEWKIAVSERVR
jgi:hypothetical protein